MSAAVVLALMLLMEESHQVFQGQGRLREAEQDCGLVPSLEHYQ